jgi:hypothetical protein
MSSAFVIETSGGEWDIGVPGNLCGELKIEN